MWSILVDPHRVIGCLPDVEVLELRMPDPSSFQGKVKTGVSFIKGTFAVDAQILEREPPRRARLKLRSTGMGSTVDVDSQIDLLSSGTETLVSWKAEAVVRGTIATIGSRLLPGIVEKKAQEFFDTLRAEVQRSP